MIISDQGREFVNTITEELFKKTKTKHRITSAYHPQVFYYELLLFKFIFSRPYFRLMA